MNVFTPMLITSILIGFVAIAEPPADDLLAGPTIDDEEVTEQDMLARRLQETGKSTNLNPRQQSRMWLTALKSLDLTVEQTETIQNLKHEFEEKQSMFQKTYGDELRSLRKEQSAAKKDGGTPSTESRVRMMELLELMPDVSAFQETGWVLLTEDQQTAFQLKYQELVEEEQQRKESQKKNGRTLMDDKQTRGFGPEDSMLRDKSNPKGDNLFRDPATVDEATLRRIKFLRRLQELQEETK